MTGLTVSVTVIVAGEFCAPADVTVICPVYVLALNPVMFAESWSADGALPPAGETASHALSLTAVKLRVPVPVLVTLTEAGEGLLPPAVALSEILFGDTVRIGCGGGVVTPKVTAIVAGEPCAPDAVIVMRPL